MTYNNAIILYFVMMIRIIAHLKNLHMLDFLLPIDNLPIIRMEGFSKRYTRLSACNESRTLICFGEVATDRIYYKLVQ